MKKLLFILLLFALCTPLGAQTMGTPKHIDANFRQVRSSAMLQQEQIMTGRFVFDSPDRVEWKYDGGVEAHLPEQMLRFIANAVSGGLLEPNEDFDASREGNTLVLTPKKKQMKKLFASITIRFSPKTGIAEEVVMTEAGGDTTIILFTNIHYRR